MSPRQKVSDWVLVVVENSDFLIQIVKVLLFPFQTRRNLLLSLTPMQVQQIL